MFCSAVNENAEFARGELLGGLDNDFETPVFRKFPVLAQVKKTLLRAGAERASLSGSGSVVYGLFPGGFPGAPRRAAVARAGENHRERCSSLERCRAGMPGAAGRAAFLMNWGVVQR